MIVVNRKKKIIVSSILIISILFIAVGSYFSSYYPAKQEIINSYVFSSSTNVNQTSLGYEIKDVYESMSQARIDGEERAATIITDKMRFILFILLII